MMDSGQNCELTPSYELMILQSDLDVAARKLNTAEYPSSGRTLWDYQLLFAFLVFFIGVAGLQVLSGSYRSEFSAYPDEPAHYVTSLMVWDYFHHFHFQSPLTFAKDYYDHYPKVALGHWPPFFYLIQAVWMMIFTPSRAAVRLEIALTTAMLAAAVFIEIRKRFDWKSAGFAGLLCVALPLVQTYSSEEMAEAMLTLCCFWSAVFFAKFIDSVRLKHAVLFAVFFSLAVLTKGNGWLLALVPAITIVLTRKFAVLRAKAFWISVVLVGACCLPWQLMTMRMAERGWEGGTHPSMGYSLSALWEFLLLFPVILGPVLLVVMLIGIYSLIVRPLRNNRIDSRDASLCALLIAVWVFHSIVPAGVEDRKLIIAVPAMIYFLVAGAVALARLLPSGNSFSRWRLAGVTTILIVSFFLQTFHIPRVEHYGFDRVAAFIAARPALNASNILISSQSVGEGLLVSELAMLQPDPVARVVRATKALATVEWNGAGYQCRYPTVKGVVQFLRDNRIGIVVTDNFPPVVNFLHDRLLREAVKDSKTFELVGHFDKQSTDVAGGISIYRVRLVYE